MVNIVHICGAIGSGKTTLMNKLILEHKKNKKIKIIDLDDLFNKFMKKNKFSQTMYQKHIYDIININSSKMLIFVGLNKDMGHSNMYYDLQSKHKLFINLDINENIKRQFMRDYDYAIKDMFLNPERFFPYPECLEINKKHKSLEQIYNEWCKDTKHTERLCRFVHNISPEGIRNNILNTRKEYKTQNYVFKNSENVHKYINRLILKIV